MHYEATCNLNVIDLTGVTKCWHLLDYHLRFGNTVTSVVYGVSIAKKKALYY